MFDCIIVEVPNKDYLRWDSERTLFARNRMFNKLYQHFSIDEVSDDLNALGFDLKKLY